MSIYDRASVNVSHDVAQGLDRAVTVEGKIPDGLNGTLLRTGPGLLSVGVDPLNFFDGHDVNFNSLGFVAPSASCGAGAAHGQRWPR